MNSYAWINVEGVCVSRSVSVYVCVMFASDMYASRFIRMYAFIVTDVGYFIVFSVFSACHHLFIYLAPPLIAIVLSHLTCKCEKPHFVDLLRNKSESESEIAVFLLHYSSASVKKTFWTDMWTHLGPRSATILTPLRGLAASLRGLQPPHVRGGLGV